MKKIKLQMKRLLIAYLVSFTLFSSIFSCYLQPVPVRGAEVAIAGEVVKMIVAALASNGIVTSSNNTSLASSMGSLFSNIANGATTYINGYGDVDFSDFKSVADWYVKMSMVSIGGTAAFLEKHPASTGVVSALKTLDSISYSHTGTSASKSLIDNLGYLQTATSSEENYKNFQNTFKMLSGATSDSVDYNFMEWMRSTDQTEVFKYVNLVSLLGVGYAADTEELGIAKLQETVFGEIASLNPSGLYFTGYHIAADGYYHYNSSRDVFCRPALSGKPYNGLLCDYLDDSKSLKKLVLVQRDYIYFIYGLSSDKTYLVTEDLRGYWLRDDGEVFLKDQYYLYRPKIGADIYLTISSNLPIFKDKDSALKFLLEVEDSIPDNFTKPYDDVIKDIPYSPAYAPSQTLVNNGVTIDDLMDISDRIDALSGQIGTDNISDLLAKAYTQSIPTEPSEPEVEVPEVDGILDWLSVIVNLLKTLPGFIFKEFDAAFLAIPTAIADLFKPDQLLNSIDAIYNLVTTFPIPDVNFYDLISGIPASLTDLYDLVTTFPIPDVNFYDLISGIPASLTDLYDLVTTFPIPDVGFFELISTIPATLVSMLDGVIALPDSLADLIPAIDIDGSLSIAKIIELVTALVDQKTDPGGSGGEEEEGSSSTSGMLSFFNILYFIVMILIMLLVLFISCLRFIVSIFKIPASTAFLPNDMLTAFEFMKSIQIPHLNMGVYDFCMAIVYMGIMFSIIRMLRREISRFRIPKS